MADHQYDHRDICRMDVLLSPAYNRQLHLLCMVPNQPFLPAAVLFPAVEYTGSAWVNV